MREHGPSHVSGLLLSGGQERRRTLRAEESKVDPNEVCRICGEKRSAHLPPGETHPREARGEGHYEMVSYWEGFDFNRCEWRRDETWRFVSHESQENG